jgi:GMP synthase PP-ATPase subunit
MLYGFPFGSFIVTYRRSVQVIALRAVQSEDFMTADWYVPIYQIFDNEHSG